MCVSPISRGQPSGPTLLQTSGTLPIDDYAVTSTQVQRSRVEAIASQSNIFSGARLLSLANDRHFF